MKVDDFDRFRLVGDEDCGVGLQCRDCSDGGQVLAYLTYPGDNFSYKDDPKVAVVFTVTDLLSVGRTHLDKSH